MTEAVYQFRSCVSSVQVKRRGISYHKPGGKYTQIPDHTGGRVIKDPIYDTHFSCLKSVYVPKN